MPRFMKASRFVAQVTPYNASPIAAIFDVRGAEAVVKQMQTACSVPGLEAAQSTATATKDSAADGPTGVP